MKKILSLLFSLLLLAAFYVYAVLMEDERSHDAPQWMVEERKPPLDRIEAVSSTDAAQLARAMGVSLPLPGTLSSGTVESGSYHGYTVRALHAEGAGLVIRGVRPLSAAPAIRTNGLSFLPSDSALLGFPVLTAQQGSRYYYYFTAEDAAFEISVTASSSAEAAQLLSPLTLVKPN